MKTLDLAQSVAHLRALIEKTDPNSELFETPNRHSKFVQQLERLVRLLEEEETAIPTLAQISDFVFPGLKDSSRRTAFASFRTLLSKAATEIGHTFECIQPDQRGRDKHEIQCRFEGRPLPTEPGIRETTRRATAGIDRIDFIVTNPPFAAMKSGEMEKVVKGQLPRDDKGRIPIKFFASYTRKDGGVVDRLLEKLRYDLDASEKYSFEFWKDTRIPLGEEWHDEIQSALEECDIGLALVSPGFFSSNYITEEELPVLVSGEKPLIPIAVKPIDFDRHNLHGLEAKQIFRFEENGKPRAFSECRQGVADRYILALARKVEERAEASVRLRSQALLMEAMGDSEKAKALLERFPELRRMVNRPSAISQKETGQNRKKSASDTELRQLSRRVFAKFPTANKIEPTVGAGGLEEVTKLVRNSRLHDQEGNPYERFREHRRLAIDYLRDWLGDPDSAPFAAVLGEVGSGKTTMLQLLAKAVGDDPDEPPVIFIDLRDYQGTKELTLEKILSEYLRRYDPEKKLIFDEIVDAVQNRNALVIFDGLDEKIISMSEGERHGFIRELWRILPVDVMDRSVAEGRGRMIISCRSHYFPTVQSLNSGYVAQDRQGVKTQDYVACVMLPWDFEQVEEYLRLALGDDHVEAALETIASVHNLTDLSQRPYLLNLITPELESLQLEQAAGRSVNAAALYEKFIERWLRRDEGKHVFTIEHKRLLMEQLAADLWRDGAREWPWEQVAEWLDQFLFDHPIIADRYQRDGATTATLAQDFRTATFFVRPDASDDGFRFAHTSLQEFFLAGHIVRSFGQGADQGILSLRLPEPSVETFSFIGQMLERLPDRTRDRTFENFAEMMADRKTPKESRRNGLLAYFLGAEDDDPLPECSLLAANDLEIVGWNFAGTKLNPTNLPPIDFSNSTLIRVSFENFCFPPETRWTDTDLRSSEFVRCSFKVSRWDGCHAQGAILRECEFTAEPDGLGRTARFQKCYGVREAAPSGLPSAQLQHGHSDSIMSVAYSPDGSYIATGSHDSLILLWDPTNAQCIRSLEGHTDSVLEVTFSPSGAQIASGSSDGTIRLWDSRSGRCLFSLKGHTDAINCVAFSPNGRRLVSASDDHTIRLWNAESGECISSLTVYREPPNSAKFSSDGLLIASGSTDTSLKLLDSGSGKIRQALEGHTGPVLDLDFSPDNSLIVSGSLDETIGLWDIKTGQKSHSFKTSGSGVRRVCFSPDGKKIASSGEDKSVVIWDVKSHKKLRSLGTHYGAVCGIDFSPDSSQIVSASVDQLARLFDVHSGICVRTFGGYASWISDVSFSPDRSQMVSGSTDRIINVWDLMSGRCLQSFRAEFDIWVRDVVFSPDGSAVAGRDFNEQVIAWKLSGERIPANVHSWRWKNELRSELGNLGGIELVGRSIIQKRVGGILKFRSIALPDGNAIVLHPWNDEEARKPAHECRWKLVSGPENAWRYVSAIDRETGESYAPEYCTENGTWEIT